MRRPVTRLHPTLLLLAITHVIVDGYANVYAPLLPLLIVRLDLSLTKAGALAMVFQIAASVAQLGFGQLADHWRPRLLMITGPIVAVTVLSLIGVANSVWSLAVVLVVGGLGCAAFHPPAAALAHHLGGTRPGLAMSIYITGGTLGFSLGPLVFAPLAERMGVEWTPVLMVPGLIIVVLALRRVPPIAMRATGEAKGLRALRPYAKPLALLYLIVVLRTLTALSFSTFVPVMLTRRGYTLGEAGGAVAAYLFASGLGGFIGGPLADRYPPRSMIAWSLLLAAPLVAVSPFLTGWTFVIVLALGGFFLQSTLPVNVTFGQAIAPVSAATVSSLMMGFAWGTGGLSVPLVGWLADRYGLERTLSCMASAALLGAACAWPLPRIIPTAHAHARPSDVGIAEPGEIDGA